MAKRNKIIYWIATALLAFGMSASSLEQIFHAKEMVDLIVPLGYPLYFLYIIGIWKILGVIAILIPGFKLLKEWAYAGFFFLSSLAGKQSRSGASITYRKEFETIDELFRKKKPKELKKAGAP